MKKKILGIVFAIGLAVGSSLTWSLNRSNNGLNSVSLANLEALTYESYETPNGDIWVEGYVTGTKTSGTPPQTVSCCVPSCATNECKSHGCVDEGNNE